MVSDQKRVLKGELRIWRNQESGYIGNQGRVPNSRIQFASNESKLVPRKLDPGTLVSKVGLKKIREERKGLKKEGHFTDNSINSSNALARYY